MKRLYNRVNRVELKKKLEESIEPRTTLSFYRYHQLSDPAAFRDELYAGLDQLGVFGRIYIASEGINGQISVLTDTFDDFKNYLYSIPWLNGCRLNIAVDDNGKSFFKLNIKLRNKIVADGLDDSTFDVTKRGKHLSAPEVNALLDKPDTIVVDMRNHYESEVGHYENAICPDVETFREALPLVEDLLADKKKGNIVMYCTGGIRCEKASAYYLHKGFEHVYMIDGGIIEYTRQCEEQNLPNKFIGKNFVFDERLGERMLFQNAINAEHPAIFIKIVLTQLAMFSSFSVKLVPQNIRLAVLRYARSLMNYPKWKEKFKNLISFSMEQNLEKADIKHLGWEN
jgi:UPF0176 protein